MDTAGKDAIDETKKLLLEKPEKEKRERGVLGRILSNKTTNIVVKVGEGDCYERRG